MEEFDKNVKHSSVNKNINKQSADQMFAANFSTVLKAYICSAIKPLTLSVSGVFGALAFVIRMFVRRHHGSSALGKAGLYTSHLSIPDGWLCSPWATRLLVVPLFIAAVLKRDSTVQLVHVTGLIQVKAKMPAHRRRGKWFLTH